jgi:ABC-type transport system substrate-binding protein
VEAWIPGENVRLERVAGGPRAAGGASTGATPSASPGASGGPPPTIILRWATDAADRMALLSEATVDGIDTPGAADLAQVATLPELAVVPRPGLATAYLGFGTGHGFDSAIVRRAFAEAIDVEALAGDAFPAGSVAATHATPCEVVGGCAGDPWYAYNAPDAEAVLRRAQADLASPIPLHVPDSPLPGLPDPAGVAAAVRDQLKASVGATVEIDVMPAADLARAVAAGRLDGLYLGGVASTLADPSGYLGALFGPAAAGTAAERADGVRAALEAAAATADAGERRAAFKRANDAVRSTAPVVPLVHPGSTSAFRADVAGVKLSPIGVDPLGTFVPADRGQLVVMGAAEPTASWCAMGGDPDTIRLCGLVTPGLYAFERGSLTPVPALASRCTPSDDATVWTCRLRAGRRFTDGKAVDAGDVLASLVAQADAGGRLRASLPTGSLVPWDELFGGQAIAPASP